VNKTNIVIAPGLLPDSGTIHVVAQEDTRDHLMTVLRAIKPEVDFKAYDGGEANFVLRTEPDQNLENAHLMPLPIGDPWGWWEWSKRATECPQGLAGALAENLPLPPLTEDESYGDNRHFMRQHFKNLPAEIISKIEKIASRLADEESKKCYEAILFGTPQGLAKRYHARLFNSLQYTDFVRLDEDAVILNGGVHEGPEIPIFAALTNCSAHLHNIDPGGYDYLSPYAQRWLSVAGEKAFKGPFALSDKMGRKEMAVCDDGQLNPRFQKVEGTGINLDVFPSMTLEGYIKSRNLERVDLIKLDLEGDEETVVPAMIDLTHRFRPQLAISIYHKAQHFWSIPEFLMGHLEGYRFHMGHYASQCYEAILYAIPEEVA